MAAEDFGPHGGWAVDATEGDVIAKLNIDHFFGGGTILHIHSNPATGLVARSGVLSRPIARR